MQASFYSTITGDLICLFVLKQFLLLTNNSCLKLCKKCKVIGRAKRALHWGVQLRFRVIYMCRLVGQYVCRVQKCRDGITWPKHTRAQSQIWMVKTDL